MFYSVCYGKRESKIDQQGETIAFGMSVLPQIGILKIEKNSLQPQECHERSVSGEIGKDIPVVIRMSDEYSRV